MSKDAKYQRLAMRIFVEFSGAIAIPAVGGALLGQWLDTRYGTDPRYLFICMTLGFVLSAIMVTKKAKLYSKHYEELNSSDKTSKKI